MASISLGVPPLLMILIPNKLRVFIWSVVFFWFMMIVSAQYHLAYTPGYDSIAPGLSVFMGWLPATIYSTIWLFVVIALQYLQRLRLRLETPAIKPPQSPD